MARNKPRKLKKAASERFRLSGADGNEESGADVNEESGADGNEESGADVNGGEINFNASDASDMRGKEKNNEAYRKHSVISFIICEVLADVAAVALILLGRTGAERYGSASVPATDDITDAGKENAATFDENDDGENRGSSRLAGLTGLHEGWFHSLYKEQRPPATYYDRAGLE